MSEGLGPGGLQADIEVVLDRFRLEVALEVARGEVVAIVGPNGAGKSTLLRALAGLVPLSAGTVAMDGMVMEDAGRGLRMATEERPVGVVFQDGLLFPHLNALDNVAFGLRCRGMGTGAARGRARRWLAELGLAERAGARPRALSGGERQRVALARALAVEPALLLLDEPLSALDVEGRSALRRDLRRQLAPFPGSRLLVTHDPLEAMTLADRLVVLEGGRVTQKGAPADVARAPRSSWVAELVGVTLLRGRGRGDGVELDGGGWLAAAGAGTGPVVAVVHPRAVALHRRRPEGTPRNVWHGRAAGVDLLGDRARVQVAVDDRAPIVAEVTPAAVAELHLDEGGEVWVSVKATEVSVHPA